MKIFIIFEKVFFRMQDLYLLPVRDTLTDSGEMLPVYDAPGWIKRGKSWGKRDISEQYLTLLSRSKPCSLIVV